MSFLRKVLSSYFVQRQKMNIYEGLTQIKNVPDLRKQQLIELNSRKKEVLNKLFKSIEMKAKGCINLWNMKMK